MKKSMFDCALLQYKVLCNNRKIFEFKDSVLINAQQMIEMILKVLLKSKIGSYSKSHNLKTLMKECNEPKLYNKYYNLLMQLTDLYFTNRYESEDYEDFNEEEFNEIIDESVELFNEIKSLVPPSEIKSSSSFKV